MATLTDRPTHVHTRRLDDRRLGERQLVDRRTTRGERITTYVVVALLLVAVSLGSALGFGFFFFPLALLIAAVGIFTFFLRRVRTRNPLRSDVPTTSERWADGQPLGRAEDNETVCLDCKEADVLDHMEDDDILHPRDVTPTGREGPPPTVPFP